MSNTKHPLYGTWLSMRNRCNNINNHAYKYYGARGIEVCKEWDSFAQFVADMGERPEGMTLDRIDNDCGYYPTNCRWATVVEQRLNRGYRQDSYPTLARERLLLSRCKRGHEFNKENTQVRSNNKRACLACIKHTRLVRTAGCS